MVIEANKSVGWGQIGWISLLLIALIGPGFGPIPAFLSDRLSEEGSVIALLLTLIVAFLVIIYVALRSDGRTLSEIGPWIREMGFARPSRWGAIVVGTLVGLAWGALFLSSFLQIDPNADLFGISLFRITTALLAAFGAFLEDILGRGFVMNRLANLSIPRWGQALFSALLFAIYHTIWSFNIFAFIFSIVYGLILAGLFLWGKRSLTPVILAHSLAVLVSEPFATLFIFVAGAI